MPLFEMPKRNNSKANDMKLAKQKVVRKATPTIKGGSSLFERISNIQRLVEKHLGKYKDEYTIIQDESHLYDYISRCIDNGVISIDTETTGLDPLLDDIAGICIYTPDEPGAYIPINHVSYITNVKLDNQLSIEYIREQFERIIDASIDIIMFNACFDIRVLRNKVGLHNIYCTWDCYLAQRLLNENEGPGNNKLKPLHKKYVLNGEGDAFTFDELFDGISFILIPLKTAYLYAAHDPKITYELYDYQRQYLRPDSDREDMRKLYWVMMNIEMPCVDATATMEDNGVLFDPEYQQVLSVKYNKLVREKLEEFHKSIEPYEDAIRTYKLKHPATKLDYPINVKSPQQLAILFYDIIGIDVIDKKSPRGTGEEILSKVDNPIAKAILDYRTMSKLVDTYIDKLSNCVNPNDGRIHANFNQYGADTGRFSSKDPNLQNIPSHNKDIRKMFIASPGYVLMSSDFSQQEPKCLAALCRKQGDPQMYNTFMEGKDLYSEIASKAFNQPYEMCLEHFPKGTKIKYVRQKKKWYYGRDDDYDKIADGETDVYDDGKERRTQAKSILLGALYGRGVSSIAEQLGCTTEEAQYIKDSVFRGFPAIKKFEQDSFDMAYDIGYVTTVCGRKRRLPDYQLDEYEFRWKNGYAPDADLLDFDDKEEQEIPERTIRKYLTQLHKARFNEKRKIFERANEEGIWIVDNGAKIAEASRKIVNSRIQGSAADLTKLAMIELNKNSRLKELGFRLLIQVHDEIIAECPEENVKECSKLLADTMSKSAEKILEMPIKCDVTVTKQWYGEEVSI